MADVAPIVHAIEADPRRVLVRARECVRRHYDELEAGGHFTRPVEEAVLTRFLDCGDLHQGFARIYCDHCGHDYLLAFSCKARYFCPSCHQKRMLAYGEWVEEHVLAPVPHRQYVFARPKLLRPYLRQRRERLAKLCQIIADLLRQGFQAMAPEGRPGFILYVQTFGDLVTFNPHVHALVADGVFYPSGSFRVLPPIPEAALTEALRHRIRTPFALEKMTYDRNTGMVIYRCIWRRPRQSRSPAPTGPGSSTRSMKSIP